MLRFYLQCPGVQRNITMIIPNSEAAVTHRQVCGQKLSFSGVMVVYRCPRAVQQAAPISVISKNKSKRFIRQHDRL